MIVLGYKNFIFKRLLGVYCLVVQDEAVGAYDLVLLPYGGSGDSREEDGSQGRTGSVFRAFFRPQGV